MAVDGKAARGSRHDQSPAAHLQAAMTDQGRTVTQRRSQDQETLQRPWRTRFPDWPEMHVTHDRRDHDLLARTNTTEPNTHHAIKHRGKTASDAESTTS